MSPRNPLQLWQERAVDRRMDAQIARVEKYLQDLHYVMKDELPVLFFNASTRIHRISLNAAFSLLASWSLRARGQPVRYLVCHRGMVQCVLGTRPQKPSAAPPCRQCIKVSRRIFPQEALIRFELDTAMIAEIERQVSKLSLNQLMEWTYANIPLGQIVLPGLRWALRRYHLDDTEHTRLFYRQYLSSAASMCQRFERMLAEVQPRAVVLFNGIFYPEALLRFMAERRGIPVITHEVGLQPFSAFFSHKHATFREVEIKTDVNLTEAEQSQLDSYLQARFQGMFSMAGVRFWETIQEVPVHLQEKLAQFSSIVPIFTNVIFDTSQIHANTIFKDMFEWLDQLMDWFDRNVDTLFIIRAHPDENRPGKASEQSVSEWVKRTGVDRRKNVIYIGPEQELSSYQIIQRSNLVLVYNSSIGLEASILGKPVLCAGRARYTQAETVFFPGNQETYWLELEKLLSRGTITLPERFQLNARKFLFHELFRASLDLSKFLDEDPTLAGMVVFREFDPEKILESPALKTMHRGILEGEQFLLGM